MKPSPTPSHDAREPDPSRPRAASSPGSAGAFDDLARLAAQIAGVRVALIGRLTGDTIRFAASLGIPLDEIPASDALASATLEAPEILLIGDTREDSRYRASELAAGSAPNFFYAGVPLRRPAGEVIGILAALNESPLSLNVDQIAGLLRVARLAVRLADLAEPPGEARLTGELPGKPSHAEPGPGAGDAIASGWAINALRQSEMLYHSLVENLPQNILRKDLAGRFTFANQRFCQMLKRPLAEIVGQTDFDLFPPELAAKYRQDDLQVIATGLPIESVEAHQTADGGKLYVQVVKTRLLDPQGTPMGIQGIFWDVTERQKIEETLAYERDLLTALMAGVSDNIYFKDRESRFLRIGRALATAFGLDDPAAAVGKTDFDFFTEEHALPAYEDEQTIIRTGEPIIGKIEKETWKDGQEKWALTTKTAYRDQKGNVIGTFGISKDVTYLKVAEDQLAAARDAALESTRLKSEFLANISHEIRTPMNGIVGMTGLLLESPLSHDQREFVEAVRSSADALLTIVNDVLDFSKIEARKMAVETIPFDLRETIEGAVELLAGRAAAKSVELACFIPADVPQRLRGDPGRLRQVLINLVSNAVKFTERGEVVVGVTKQAETEQTVTVRFGVSDTGIGIPPEDQSRIFEAFMQADGSVTRRYGGTGLGLAISKQLVELMRGEIGVESRVGSGSTFWFTVALGKDTSSPAHPLIRQHDWTGARLLIVDANSTSRHILQQQLLSWAIPSDSVASHEDALAALRQAAELGAPYSAIVLDLQLPGVDGLDFAHALRLAPGGADVRVVALASNRQRLGAEALQAAAIDACLPKPVKPSRLLDCLNKIMAVRSLGALIEGRSLAAAHVDAASTPLKSLRILLAEENMVNQKVALLQLRKLGYKADAVANGVEVAQALAHIPYDVILIDLGAHEGEGLKTVRRIRDRGPGATPPYIIAMKSQTQPAGSDEYRAAGVDACVAKPFRPLELEAALAAAQRASRPAPQFSSP